MRKKYIFGKKLYISLLTTILILLTTVATTFAWIGVFANSTFESFDFKIKSSNLEEYGIEISLTGEEGSFGNSISSDDIKRAILINWGYSEDFLTHYGNVDGIFNKLRMAQCTTLPVISGNKMISFGDFTDLEGNLTKEYYTFDIYISAVQFYDSGTNSSSDYKLDLFLDEGLLSGNERNKILLNPFTFPDSFENPLNTIDLPDGITPVAKNTRITSASLNSKSACRVGFEKYSVVNKYHPEQYSNTSTPISAIIYSGDTYNYPTYNSNSGTYEFGGILNDDLNVAVGYYNSTEWKYNHTGVKSVSVDDSTADIFAGDIYTIRGVGGTIEDKLFNSSTNHLIDSSIVEEQIGINQMMKVKVSFWIEGWDADCFNPIGNSPITLSISMSLKNEKEF